MCAATRGSPVDIAIVVPIYNEVATLAPLLEAIAAQTLIPREVIVVDAGSTDGSVRMVEQWTVQRNSTGQRCRILFNSDGMPGANRNRGIVDATSEWIAFLDAGIVPEPDWLEQLWRCADSTGTHAVLGLCRFDAETVFERAVCALSNGCGTIHPVLPASLFHRSVFHQAGWFREDLRSAEDQLWLHEVKRCYGPHTVCKEALVHYRHYPTDIMAAARKWWLYEQHSARAGLHGVQQSLLVAFFGTLVISAFTIPAVGGSLLFLYLMIRAVVDPMRRSKRLRWWGDQPRAALIALPLAFVLDAAKTLGSLRARLRLWREGRV